MGEAADKVNKAQANVWIERYISAENFLLFHELSLRGFENSFVVLAYLYIYRTSRTAVIYTPKLSLKRLGYILNKVRNGLRFGPFIVTLFSILLKGW